MKSNNRSANVTSLEEYININSLPIATTVVVAPARRRFITYNPLTGKVSHVYTIGLMMVAGTDLTYSIKMVCSNDNSCDEINGYPDGICDCARATTAITEMSLNPYLGSGSLKSGEVLDVSKTIPITLTKNSPLLRWSKFLSSFTIC